MKIVMFAGVLILAVVGLMYQSPQTGMPPSHLVSDPQVACVATAKLDISWEEEDSVNWNGGDFCIDASGQPYLLMQHSRKYMPLTLRDWRGTWPAGFIMVPGLNDHDLRVQVMGLTYWRKLVSPEDPTAKVVSGICKLGIPVRTYEGQTVHNLNEYAEAHYQDICANLPVSALPKL